MLDRYTWVAYLSPPGGSLVRYMQRNVSVSRGRQFMNTLKFFCLFYCTLQTRFYSFIAILSSFWLSVELGPASGAGYLTITTDFHTVSPNMLAKEDN